MDDTKVLYIAGMMRSGSTLLGRLLGELPGAVHVGEPNIILTPGFEEDGPCGCLEPVSRCPFWQAVFERAFGGLSAGDMTTLRRTRQLYRMRTLPRLRLTPKDSPEGRRLQDYLDALGALYEAIGQVSGARVIVDGSKDPSFGYLLRRVPGLNLHALHLVRDSRAVAFSQQRVKTDPPGFRLRHTLPVVSPLHTALDWNAVNLLLSLRKISRRSLRMRYEDVVRDPAEALALIWDLLGEPPPATEFLQASPLTLHAGHTLAGNPDRFQATIRIRLDDEWQRKMKPSDRRLMTALTWPLLRRYGYLSPRKTAPEPLQRPAVL